MIIPPKLCSVDISWKKLYVFFYPSDGEKSHPTGDPVRRLFPPSDRYKNKSIKLKTGYSPISMSKLYSVVTLKCPRCHKGNLFTKPNPYSLKDSLKMPDRCPVCNQDFQIEPGFYIGALWTSFPIVIFLMTLLSVLLLVVIKMQLEWFFVAITIILLSLQPIIIRLGRAIWINIFVDYDQDAENK